MAKKGAEKKAAGGDNKKGGAAGKKGDAAGGSKGKNEDMPQQNRVSSCCICLPSNGGVIHLLGVVLVDAAVF